MYEVDVLVAGGGVAGVLTAAQLTTMGFRCLLVEPRAIAAEQSGHSHGYLHKGYIYYRAERNLVRNLMNSRQIWDRYLSGSERVAADSDLSLVGFENDNVARLATGVWDGAGLSVNELGSEQWPNFLNDSPLTRIYSTNEPSFDFTSVLSRIATNANGLTVIRGRVTRFGFSRKKCTSVECEIGGRVRKIRARYLVLACGGGNAKIILNTFGYFQAAPSTRTSFMLVVRGKPLPQLSLILPENQFYGLFMVSRKIAGDGVWLASNYLSYSGHCTSRSVAARTWSIATLRTLDSLFPKLLRRGIRLGLYAAPKAELRRDPERLPEDKVVEHYGMTNVAAVWPTKLTLAPLITNELAGIVSTLLKQPANFGDLPRVNFPSEALPTARERWKSVRLSSRSEFLARLGPK